MDYYSFESIFGIMNLQNNEPASTRLSDNWRRKVMRRSHKHYNEIAAYNELKFKPDQVFCTGSKYKGQWNALGMSGEGEYTMFHGKIL